MKDISDEELMKLILAADDETLQEGKSPKQRMILVISKVMKELGYKGFVFGVGAPPIVEKIVNLYRSLYRSSDLAIGGIHGGIFMFRMFSRAFPFRSHTDKWRLIPSR